MSKKKLLNILRFLKHIDLILFNYLYWFFIGKNLVKSFKEYCKLKDPDYDENEIWITTVTRYKAPAFIMYKMQLYHFDGWWIKYIKENNS